MGVFCKEAIQTKVSPTMVERAAGLLDLINEHVRFHLPMSLCIGVLMTIYVRQARQDSQPKPVLSPGRPVLQPNEITPQGLALALTLLEGDKYKAILPCDYLANQCRRSGFNGVDDAASTNNRIIEWIKQSLLHWDALQQRAGVVKFYLSTAQVNIFSSTSITHNSAKLTESPYSLWPPFFSRNVASFGTITA
jgi:son of sevenless-like protein